MKVLLIDLGHEKNCQITQIFFTTFNKKEKNLTVINDEKFEENIHYYLIHYDFIFFKSNIFDDFYANLIQKYKSYSTLVLTPMIFLFNENHIDELSKHMRLDNFDYILNPMTESDILNKINHYHKMNNEIHFQNYKMAVKGTILNKLEHQWKQPLNFISTNLLNLEIKSELGKLEHDSIEKINSNIAAALIQISNNISLLNKCFESSKNKTYFPMNNAIEKNLALLEYKLKQNNIKLEKKYQNDNIEVHNYESDFSLKIVLLLLVIVECSIKEKEKSEELIIDISYDKNENDIGLFFSLNKPVSFSYIVEMFTLEFFLIKTLLQKTGTRFSSKVEDNNSFFKLTFSKENLL